MKSSLPIKLVLVFFITSNILFSQEWYEIGTKWTFNDQTLMPYPAHGIVEYTVVKDTIINDTIAKRVDVLATSYDGIESKRTSIYVSESDSKVLVWDQGQFRLMYDLNLIQGDTLKTDNRFCNNSTPLIVDSLSTIMVNDIELKIQYLSYEYSTSLGEDVNHVNVKITEKIGNEKDFVFMKYCDIAENFAYQGLRCYQSSSLVYYNPWWQNQFPNVDCNSLINEKETSIDEVSALETITISPNPTNSTVTVKSSNIFSVRSVKVYNATGRLIAENQCIGGECNIDLSREPKGMYLFTVNSLKGQVKTVKVLKE